MPTKTTNEECTLVVPSSFADGQDQTFYDRLEKESDRHPGQIFLDCSELGLVQSSHIGLLWLALDICKRASVVVILKNTTVVLQKSLRVLDLAEFFEIDPHSAQVPAKSATPVVSNFVETDYTSKFAANIVDIDNSLEDFVEFLHTLKIGNETSFNLRTVFYEVATNIRCHAGLQDNELIRFSASYENGLLTQVFKDTGKSFDFTAHLATLDPHSAAQKRQTRGFGISLIRGLVGKVVYKRTDKGDNVLSLTTDCREIQ